MQVGNIFITRICMIRLLQIGNVLTSSNELPRVELNLFPNIAISSIMKLSNGKFDMHLLPYKQIFPKFQTKRISCIKSYALLYERRKCARLLLL